MVSTLRSSEQENDCALDIKDAESMCEIACLLFARKKGRRQNTRGTAHHLLGANLSTAIMGTNQLPFVDSGESAG